MQAQNVHATVELAARRSSVFGATFLPNGSDKRQRSGRIKAVGCWLESGRYAGAFGEGKPLALLVACANVYDGCIFKCMAMACRDFFIQPYQFNPESDPQEEAPEEVQTLWLQQDISEWLVCLNNVSLFVYVVTVTTM